MKTIIKLDEDDLERIVAEHFHVNVDVVHINVSEVCTGYGMMESYTYKASCTVEREENSAER